LQEDGAVIPAPTLLDDVMAEPDDRDAVAFLVDVATRRSIG
jgi:hypothetical protein